MKRRIISVTLTMVLFVTMVLSTGCTNRVQAIECTKDIVPSAVEEISDYTEGNKAATEFAVNLFKASSTDGKNSLVSPLSVMSALAMTANGADGETLKEMEKVLGMSVDDLNKYLHSYIKNLPQGEKYKFSVANSIWINQAGELTPNQQFLQTNVDYYDAVVYKTEFDNQAVKDINNWVSKNTDKMIKKIVDDVAHNQVMYLINAVAMDAQWQDVYESSDVRKGTFTLANGTEKKVDFMYSSEGKYLSDDYAKGFIKYYKERKYAYVALLPDADIPLDDYVDKLTGEYISDMLNNAENTSVKICIPKYKMEYNIGMTSALMNMGIKYAFMGDKADFSKLGTSSNGNVYIDEVRHKTYIEVYEQGTKAGAVTMVGMKDGAAPMEVKEVYLNRPFVYMIIDCEHNIPVFMGTMHDVSVKSVEGHVDADNAGGAYGDDVIGEPVDETRDVEFTAKRIRTSWREGVNSFGDAKVIKSREALENYVKTQDGISEEYAKYDDKFFAEKMLLITSVSENSGSIGHKVTRVELSPDGSCDIFIKRTIPEIGTCDMASWNILVELDKDCGISGNIMVKSE